MTLAHWWWLSAKLALARWHDRQAESLISKIEADLRNRGWRV